MPGCGSCPTPTAIRPTSRTSSSLRQRAAAGVGTRLRARSRARERSSAVAWRGRSRSGPRTKLLRSCTARFGFAPAGVRKRYYDNTEDAIVMWCHDLRSSRLPRTPAAARRRYRPDGDRPRDPRRLHTRARHRDELRRDRGCVGDGRQRRRVERRVQPDRSARRLRRRGARDRQPRPPRSAQPGDRPGDRRSGRRRESHRCGRLHLRPGPDRRAAGRGVSGQGPGAGVGRAVRRASTTSKPTCTRRSSRTRRSSSRSSYCSSRAVTRCSSRCRAMAATGCSARRSTTPPARRSTRWRASSTSAIRAGRRSTASRSNGDPDVVRFPRAMSDDPDNLDFSFSGLKTVVVNYVRKHPDVGSADIAASFQMAVVDVLVTKARRAAQRIGAKGIVLGGGVAANSLLREELLDACAVDGRRGFLPSRDDVHRQRGDDRRRRVVSAGLRRPEPARRRRVAEPTAAAARRVTRPLGRRGRRRWQQRTRGVRPAAARAARPRWR